MGKFIPDGRPSRTRDWVEKIVAVASPHLRSTKFCLVGCRGYYLDSMGKPKENDRGLYDDAVFLVGPGIFVSFNFNTDPTSYRKGMGHGTKKGMATLDPGVWWYKKGLHKGKYHALVQADHVFVTRDGAPAYRDSGMFGINIHKGGIKTTSSEGCQTLPPDQWNSFIELTFLQMKKFDQKEIAYILVEKQG